MDRFSLSVGSKGRQLEVMLRYMAELGLTPVARTRVDVRPQTGRSKFAGLLGPRHDEDDWKAERFFT